MTIKKLLQRINELSFHLYTADTSVCVQTECMGLPEIRQIKDIYIAETPNNTEYLLIKLL